MYPLASVCLGGMRMRMMRMIEDDGGLVIWSATTQGELWELEKYGSGGRGNAKN